MAKAKGLRDLIESTIAEDAKSAATENETAVVPDSGVLSTDSEGEVEHGADEEHAGDDPESGGEHEAEADSQNDPNAGGAKPAKEGSAYSKAPASWKGEAKQVWDALPEKARREVTRREKQIDRTLNETAQVRQEYQAIQGVVQQYEPRLREWNVPPAAALQQFMEVDRVLSSGNKLGAAQRMAKLIVDYGIDIKALDAALSGTAAPPDLDMEARIQAMVDQRTAPIMQRYQQEQQESVRKVADTIQSMEDNPEYPHFEEVRIEMADLIEFNFARGVAISLDEAYNRITGYKGLSRAAPRASGNARRALGASVSVGGSPAAVGNQGNPADLRGTILKAFEG